MPLSPSPLHEPLACHTRLGVYRALLRIGWLPIRERAGSHVQLRHPDYAEPYTWAFHDSVEIGPAMLARIAKKTGLKPEEL